MEFDSAALCGCVESPSTKRSVSLHPRLEAAAALLGKTSVLADIGCDHGRFSAAMLQRGIAEKVIASDISAPSLKKAEQLANVCGLSSKMECRISNGFSAYSALVRPTRLLYSEWAARLSVPYFHALIHSRVRLSALLCSRCAEKPNFGAIFTQTIIV